MLLQDFIQELRKTPYENKQEKIENKFKELVKMEKNKEIAVNLRYFLNKFEKKINYFTFIKLIFCHDKEVRKRALSNLNNTLPKKYHIFFSCDSSYTISEMFYKKILTYAYPLKEESVAELVDHFQKYGMNSGIDNLNRTFKVLIGKRKNRQEKEKILFLKNIIKTIIYNKKYEIKKEQQ